ncbi:SERPINB10, partial [Cervus elaphus hippelaphus]
VLQFSRDQDSKFCPDSEKKRKMEFNVGKPEEIHFDFQTLISEINSSGHACILKTANRIYGEKTYLFHKLEYGKTEEKMGLDFSALVKKKKSIKGDFTYIFQKYLEDMQTYFGAESQSVNFMGASDQIRKEINSWVEKQTEGKLSPRMLPKKTLVGPTHMLILEIIISSQSILSEQPWSQGHYFSRKTTSKPVQMMSMKEKLQVFYIESPQAIGLQLYYLEKAITYEKLSEWTSADMMELCNVQLNLPKFKLEETYDLKSTLSSMGMSDAFNQSKADFSGMSSERKLFLSNVFHKSFVEINEQGTEAAAGTGNEVSVRIKLPSIEFNADHPFLFFIRHNKTNCILFYGRFCSP